MSILHHRSPSFALPGLAVALSLCVSFVAPAVGQVPAPPPGGVSTSTQGEAFDPPGRVGRLSELTGQVWLYHPGGGEWISAERNRPLTTGDRLATDAGARAEVRIGSTTLRLDAGSELEVLRLDDERIDFKLHNGSLAARLRSREAVPEFALDTGEGRFTVQRTGRYRFDRRDEASFVTVDGGQALYEGPGSALTVNGGQRAEFWLDRANAAQYSLTEPVRDAFAGWTAERDRGDDRSASARYVSPEMTGVEDLDRYGRWEDSPEYGAVWYPRAVAQGWAPYSSGRWAWVQPWGWTWVDEAPWGFAPFHYGRWVYFRNNWCWSPGQFVRRPVYAPALVAWVGGPRLSVSINIGGGPAVGWVPLAPREVFVPTYRVTQRYVREVNVTQVTNITNITTIVNNPQLAVQQRDFSNRKFPHAVTVVPASVLSSRQAVAPEAARWRDAPEVREFNRQPSHLSAVVAPAAIAPVQMPAALRGEVVAPPGHVRNLTPRFEGPQSPRRPDAPAVIATPAVPNPARPVAPPAVVMPTERVEPPSRVRVYPGNGGGEPQRQGDRQGGNQSPMQPRMQAPQAPQVPQLPQMPPVTQAPAPAQMQPPVMPARSQAPPGHTPAQPRAQPPQGPTPPPQAAPMPQPAQVQVQVPPPQGLPPQNQPPHSRPAGPRAERAPPTPEPAAPERENRRTDRPPRERSN